MIGHHQRRTMLDVERLNTRWWEQGACVGTDPELWFPSEGPGGNMRVPDEAKALCARCPVAGPCLDDALAHPADSSVRAGTSPRTRVRIRARRRTPVQSGDSQ